MSAPVCIFKDRYSRRIRGRLSALSLFAGDNVCVQGKGAEDEKELAQVAGRGMAAVLTAACPPVHMVRAEEAVLTSGAPGVSAASCVLYEPESGRLLFEKDAHTARSIASTTKLMTALLAAESGDLDRVVTVTKEAVLAEGTALGLREGRSGHHPRSDCGAAAGVGQRCGECARDCACRRSAIICGGDECPRAGNRDEGQPLCHSVRAGRGRTCRERLR